MVTYKYSAISRDGQKVNGVIDGYNELDAVQRIKQTCDVVLKITEVKNDGVAGLLNFDLSANKLDPKAFTVMCNQFAIILRAGIPIARTVHLIADKTTDKNLKRVLRQVASDVEAGRSLAASFSDRGEKLLPPTFIETLRAGEESGNVDKSFQTMADHYDKQTKINAKVKGALSYPLFVLFVAVVVVIVLMVKVVPTFMAIFEEMGAELPLITRILIGISNFFRDYILIIVAVLAVLLLAYKIYNNTEEGRLKLAKLGLKMPILGNISSLSCASQFANSMCTMLSAGLPLVKALSITAKVLGNYYVSQEVGKLSGKLEQGYSLGACMRELDCMPDILVDMTAVGEETGELEETMNTIGGYYDVELEMAINNALAKLEPTLLIGMAVIGGFIVAAVYLAMFTMYGAM